MKKFSQVVLDSESQKKLIHRIQQIGIPHGWDLYAHHMTIDINELPDKREIGKVVELVVHSVGMSDENIAVGVSGYKSVNKIPHITVAVAPSGKQRNSNQITEWKPIQKFTVRGTVTEVSAITKTKKFSQLKEEIALLEGISDIVYHFTHQYNLEKILETDRFEMTSSIGTDVEMDVNGKGKFFYMSTARSRLGGYSSMPVGGAFIELDGRKLAQKYKGAAVDYWGRSFRLAQPRSAEMEDRIWSDKPYIENFSKYIKSISIIIEKEPDREKREDDWMDWRKNMRRVQGIMELAASKNIEVIVYDDKKAFINGHKAKGKKSLRGDETPVSEKSLHGLAEVLELGVVPQEKIEQAKSKLSKISQDFLNDVKYKYHSSMDFVRMIKNDIHNNRKAGSFGKSYVNRITMATQKLKLNSIEDVVLFIRKQWLGETN